MIRSAPLLLVMTILAGVAVADGGALTFALDLTQLYMWRGLDLLDDHPALQPSLTWNSSSGWYLGVWGSVSLDGSSSCRDISGDICRDWDEIDYYGGVTGELAHQSRWDTQWDLGYTYFSFPRQPSSADAMQLALKIRHPRLFGEGGPTPYWGVYYQRGVRERNPDGFWVIAGIVFPLTWQARRIDLAVDLTWKEGDAGLWSHTGFSNANLGIATDFACGNWTLTPALHFQLALAGGGPGIHPQDQVWVNVVLSRTH